MKLTTAPRFFPSSAEFRAWLEENHGDAQEVIVGFYKRASGKPSMTWPESVDQALCFGWIDGVRKSIDQEAYLIRFTPRKASSKWSAVNTRRVEELGALGLMQPAGLAVFGQRTDDKTAVYAYEQRHVIKLDDEQEARFRRHKKAWKYFEAQPNWYRKTALWWVASAKREQTRDKRLQQLIADSEEGQPIAHLRRTEQIKD